MSGPAPQLLAMLFCDHVLREHGSLKCSVLGIFDHINCSKFPTKHSRLWVYVRVTDAQGEYNFRLDFVNLKDGTILEQGFVKNVQIKNRMNAHEIVFQISPLPLPEEGRYEFRLYANGVFIDNQSLVAVALREQKGG